jgi:RHS repeat-associated protein
MQMPGRKFNGGYRYGFNGKENDNEVSGEGNKLDFGARIYDSKLGRWLSLDPLQKKYPNESHYAFVSNSPLLYADMDGRDKIITITIINKDGSTAISTTREIGYYKYERVTQKATFVRRRVNQPIRS